MSESGRAVACPSCSTGYFLPAELIGPRGARVRCPKCGRTFVVEALEPAAPAAPVPSSAEPADRPEGVRAGAGASQAQLAETALDALAEGGDAVARAASEGRLFAEHGREIMAAYDAWRRDAGRDADPAVFRAALRARWGIELEPLDPGGQAGV